MRTILFRFVPLILVVGLSFFSWTILLNPGYFSMHDNQHLARLFELDKALEAGQFPVRWVSGLGFGYGYPLFNFYPPFVYYLGELFHVAFRLSFIDSIKLVWFVALAGSTLSMYVLAKYFFKKLGGITAAVFYLYAPYHALDAFVRGALAELFSFVWLPLILYFSARSINEKKMSHSIYAGIFLGLLMITHNLTFLPFAGFFTLWHISLALVESRDGAKIFRNLTNLAVSFLVAFLTTAFFWLPSLYEKQSTLVDSLLIRGLASYTIHFACPSQLWNSLWGFGGSAVGCIDGISLKVGKPHLVVSGLSFFLSLFFIWKKKDKSSFIGLISVISLTLSLSMTVSWSKIIWDNVKILWYIQFPWRFIEFATLFSALTAGYFVSKISPTLVKVNVAGVLIALVIFLNAKYFHPQTLFLSQTDRDLTSEQEIKWNISGSSFEYMYKNVATKMSPMNTVLVDISPQETAKNNYSVESGSFSLVSKTIKPDKWEIVGNYKNAVVQFPVSFFPGWHAFIDGQEVSTNPQGKFKQITLSIPDGYHKVSLKFVNTPVRTLANAVSILSTLLIGMALIKYEKITKDWKIKI